MAAASNEDTQLIDEHLATMTVAGLMIDQFQRQIVAAERCEGRRTEEMIRLRELHSSIYTIHRSVTDHLPHELLTDIQHAAARHMRNVYEDMMEVVLSLLHARYPDWGSDCCSCRVCPYWGRRTAADDFGRILAILHGDNVM